MASSACPVNTRKGEIVGRSPLLPVVPAVLDIAGVILLLVLVLKIPVDLDRFVCDTMVNAMEINRCIAIVTS